jgi:hypothetical protein
MDKRNRQSQPTASLSVLGSCIVLITVIVLCVYLSVTLLAATHLVSECSKNMYCVDFAENILFASFDVICWCYSVCFLTFPQATHNVLFVRMVVYAIRYVRIKSMVHMRGVFCVWVGCFSVSTLAVTFLIYIDGFRLLMEFSKYALPGSICSRKYSRYLEPKPCHAKLNVKIWSDSSESFIHIDPGVLCGFLWKRFVQTSGNIYWPPLSSLLLDDLSKDIETAIASFHKTSV